MAFEDDTGLNDRQMAFCMYYVGEAKFNGTLAAKLAGYSEKTANEIAAENLAKLSIQNYIKELKADLGKRIGISADMIAQEYAKAGFSNVQDYITQGNFITDISQIDREKAAAVSSVKRTITTFEGGEKECTEFKLIDKLSALDKLARMIGVDGTSKGEIDLKGLVTPLISIQVVDGLPPIKTDE